MCVFGCGQAHACTCLYKALSMYVCVFAARGVSACGGGDNGSCMCQAVDMGVVCL